MSIPSVAGGGSYGLRFTVPYAAHALEAAVPALLGSGWQFCAHRDYHRPTIQGITMIRGLVSLFATVTFVSVLGCSPNPDSPRGLVLPAGDVDAGRQAFIDLQCHGCHRINGVDLPQFVGSAPVAVVLGGERTRVRTYGGLVTSIVNPSHRLIAGYPAEMVSRDGESFMPVLNDVMTVQQLVNLIALLQSSYEIAAPTDEAYSYRYQY